MKSKQDKSNNIRLIQNDQRHEPCEISFDQSKRMVTIRRINVPHAEPQVTVTAKGISPDKDKLLYTFINGQLIPSANVGNSSPPPSNLIASVNALNNISKPKQQNAKVEPPSSGKSLLKKPVAEPVLPDKNAKKSAKEKPIEKTPKTNEKTNGRKASPENSKASTLKSTKSTTNNTAAPIKEKEKDKEKDKKQKKGKKDVDSDVGTIINSTKELNINDEKPKKEKKKVKAVKFEYADPNYKVNQFDLLDMDEDDDYYIESSSEESSDDEPAPLPPPPVTKPATVTKQQTPPLSNQSSIESQSTQSNKNAKNQSVTKNVKAVENTKKAKNDSNAKVQSQKSDKKPLAESNTAPSVKSQKPQNNQAQQTTKQSNTVDDSNLSKKQKKKLEKKQNTAQTQQQQPNATRTSSKAVSNLYRILFESTEHMSTSCTQRLLNCHFQFEFDHSTDTNKFEQQKIHLERINSNFILLNLIKIPICIFSLGY